MKKIVLILFSVYILSACRTPFVVGESSNEINLGTQYSETSTKKETAADINTKLGAGYISNGRYDRALVKLNKAITEEPRHALAHNYLGVLYSRLERPDNAKNEFEYSIQLAPNDSMILNNYAIFLCEQKNFAKAEQIFKKVINNPLYIKRIDAYQNAAWCALKNNEVDRAEALYRKALTMSEDLPRSLLGLAKINYKKSNYQYAWSYFLRYDNIAIPDENALWLGINIINKLYSSDNNNRLASYELQLKSKYPDSDEAKWLFQGKQEY